MPYFGPHDIKEAFGESPWGNKGGTEASNRGRMSHIATSTAGLFPSRGVSRRGRVTFVVAAFALAFALAAWIVEFDFVAWIQDRALPKAAAALSFDDRFGSRSTLNAASIYYPSRRGVAVERGDFRTEFEQIEGLLAQQSSDEDSADLPDQPAPATVVAAVPLPRSRPAEANLQARASPLISLRDMEDRSQE